MSSSFSKRKVCMPRFCQAGAERSIWPFISARTTRIEYMSAYKTKSFVIQLKSELSIAKDERSDWPLCRVLSNSIPMPWMCIYIIILAREMPTSCWWIKIVCGISKSISNSFLLYSKWFLVWSHRTMLKANDFWQKKKRDFGYIYANLMPIFYYQITWQSIFSFSFFLNCKATFIDILTEFDKLRLLTLVNVSSV